MAETFCSHERINKQKDFSHLYHKGKRSKGRYLQLIYISNDLGYSRLGVVVSKKHGNAVERNRLKRRIRALFRKNKELINRPSDLMFMPLSEIKKANWQMLEEDYKEIIQSI